MEHQHIHESRHQEKGGLTMAFWLNLVFSLIEVVGGAFTNSTAIIADAFHDLMDAIAIGAAVLFEKVSGTKRTPGFSYGYKRFSLLSALGMSLLLLVGAVFMGMRGIESFFHPKGINSIGMLWLAVLGVCINGFAFLRIKNGHGYGHGHLLHSHSHNHAHGHTQSHNSKAIMLHLLEDVLGWVAVLIGAAAIYFTGWYWIDGILALLIAIYIAYNATKNLIGTLKILLQSVPESVNVEKLSNELNSIAGVRNIHDLHIWSLDGSYHVGSLHAVVVDDVSKDWENDIYTAIHQLMEEYNIQHPTVQIESTNRNCSLQTC